MSDAIVERLKAEEAELEKEFYKKEEELEQDSETGKDVTPDELDEGEVPFGTVKPEDTSDDDEEDSSEEESSGGKRVSWKKRFVNFKATADRNLHDLRVENSHLRVMIAERDTEIADLKKKAYKLESEIAKLQVADTSTSIKDLLSDEEKDIIGPEFMVVLDKVLASRKPETKEVSIESKELKDELEQLRKERLERARLEEQKLYEDSSERMKNRLRSLIPDWDAVDADPDFGKFLEGTDEISGVSRSNLLGYAIQNGDVAGVARFYNEFLALKPRSRKEILSEKITPKGGGSNNRPVEKGKKIYHISEYETFMDDVTRGEWRGREKEAKKIELMFDRAFQEGRVTQ